MVVPYKYYIDRKTLLSRVESGNLGLRVSSLKKIRLLAIRAKAKVIFDLLIKKSFVYVGYIHHFRRCLSGCKDKAVDVFCARCRKILDDVKKLMNILSKKLEKVSLWMSERIAGTPPSVFSEVASLSFL